MFKKFRIFSLIALFIALSVSVYADKVYSAGGTTTYATYTARGYINRIQNPTYDEISSMGLTDATVYYVYGEHTDIDATADNYIWDGATTGGSSKGKYNFSADATADIVSFSSSSASDTSADTVTVVGLDVSGDLTTQTISANGTTRVALTTALWRVISAKWNGSTANVGNIAVYTGTGTIPSAGDSKIRAWIPAGANETKIGVFTCPNDTVCFIKSAEVGVSREGDSGTEVDLQMYMKKYGYPYVKLKPRINIDGTDTRGYKYDWDFPYAIPGKTDVYMVVDAYDASTDNLGIFDYMEIMSISEDYFDTTFLTGIGQP